MDPYFEEWLLIRGVQSQKTIQNYVSTIRVLYAKGLVQAGQLTGTRLINTLVENDLGHKANALAQYLAFVNPNLLSKMRNTLLKISTTVPLMQQSKIIMSLYDNLKITQIMDGIHARLSEIRVGENKELIVGCMVLSLQLDGVFLNEKELNGLRDCDVQSLNKVRELPKKDNQFSGWCLGKEDYNLYRSECVNIELTEDKVKKKSFMCRFVKYEVSERTRNLLHKWRSGIMKGKRAKFKLITQVLLIHVMKLNSDIVLRMLGYGSSNQWVYRSKILYLVWKSVDEKGKINVDIVEQLSVKLAFHFGKSSADKRFYKLIPILREQQVARDTWQFE
jgi:hypothetical protein